MRCVALCAFVTSVETTRQIAIGKGFRNPVTLALLSFEHGLGKEDCRRR